MSEAKNKKNPRIRKLLNRYRFVVMNDDTLEERLSLSLTPLRVFVFFGTGAIVIIFLTTILIAFTPLREYVPGYGDANVRRDMLTLTQRADSLEEASRKQQLFLANIKAVIEGKEPSNTYTEPAKKANIDYNKLDLKASQTDSLLRVEVESNDKTYNAFTEGPQNMSGVYFFKPVTGVATSRFNAATGHFGVDIAAMQNDAVKAVLDGTVISAEWNINSGHTIQVQHPGNIISIYKHNSALLKKEGDRVRAGEAIAQVGNTGENSNGPHLHFELWLNGSPVNPASYINF